MVSMKVVRFSSKVPVHRVNQLLCFGGMPMITKEVKPMYSFPHLLYRMYQMRHVSVHVKVSWKV